MLLLLLALVLAACGDVPEPPTDDAGSATVPAETAPDVYCPDAGGCDGGP